MKRSDLISALRSTADFEDEFRDILARRLGDPNFSVISLEIVELIRQKLPIA